MVSFDQTYSENGWHRDSRRCPTEKRLRRAVLVCVTFLLTLLLCNSDIRRQGMMRDGYSLSNPSHDPGYCERLKNLGKGPAKDGTQTSGTNIALEFLAHLDSKGNDAIFKRSWIHGRQIFTTITDCSQMQAKGSQLSSMGNLAVTDAALFHQQMKQRLLGMVERCLWLKFLQPSGT